MLQKQCVYIINILFCTATINSHRENAIVILYAFSQNAIGYRCDIFNVDTGNIKDYNKPITTNNEVRKWPISIITEI